MKAFRVTLRSGTTHTVTAKTASEAEQMIRKGHLGDELWINPKAIDSIEAEPEKVTDKQVRA